MLAEHLRQRRQGVRALCQPAEDLLLRFQVLRMCVCVYVVACCASPLNSAAQIAFVIVPCAFQQIVARVGAAVADPGAAPARPAGAQPPLRFPHRTRAHFARKPGENLQYAFSLISRTLDLIFARFLSTSGSASRVIVAALPFGLLRVFSLVFAVKYTVQLEQWLMEGNYNKILKVCE